MRVNERGKDAPFGELETLFPPLILSVEESKEAKPIKKPHWSQINRETINEI